MKPFVVTDSEKQTVKVCGGNQLNGWIVFHAEQQPKGFRITYTLEDSCGEPKKWANGDTSRSGEVLRVRTWQGAIRKFYARLGYGTLRGV